MARIGHVHRINWRSPGTAKLAGVDVRPKLVALPSSNSVATFAPGIYHIPEAADCDTGKRYGGGPLVFSRFREAEHGQHISDTSELARLNSRHEQLTSSSPTRVEERPESKL